MLKIDFNYVFKIFNEYLSINFRSFFKIFDISYGPTQLEYWWCLSF